MHPCLNQSTTMTMMTMMMMMMTRGPRVKRKHPATTKQTQRCAQLLPINFLTSCLNCFPHNVCATLSLSLDLSLDLSLSLSTSLYQPLSERALLLEASRWTQIYLATRTMTLISMPCDAPSHYRTMLCSLAKHNHPPIHQPQPSTHSSTHPSKPTTVRLLSIPRPCVSVLGLTVHAAMNKQVDSAKSE